MSCPVLGTIFSGSAERCLRTGLGRTFVVTRTCVQVQGHRAHMECLILCPGARTNGISLIHGNHASFSPDADVLFSNVFQCMSDYDMRDRHLAEDVMGLRNILILRVANRTETERDS